MRLRRWWPHVPLALLVLASGALNLVAGLGHLPGNLSTLSAVSQYNGTLGVFGRSTQAVLGGALMLCGFGLFWRLRTPWAFALLLSAMTVGVGITRHRWDAPLIVPGVMFLGLIFYRNAFQRHAVAANAFVSVLSITSVLGYGTLGTYFLGDGFRPQVHDVSTALYYTVITLSTVGYGDIVPVTTQTRMFVISLVIVGLAIFATAVATTFGPAITNEIGRIFSGKEKRMETSDHIIVVGDGDIAEHTARALEAGGQRYVRIASAEQAMDPQALNEAHLPTARMLVAASDDDNKNAVISLTVKDLNPQVRVLAAAGSREAIRRLKLAHADVVFAPTVVVGRLMAQIVNGEPIPPQFEDLLLGEPQQ